MRSIVPRIDESAIDNNGYFTRTWYNFFASFQTGAGKIRSINPTSSPYSIEADSVGTITITGGSDIVVTLTRAQKTITGLSGLIPVSQDDVVVISYTIVPIVNFIPR